MSSGFGQSVSLPLAVPPHAVPWLLPGENAALRLPAPGLAGHRGPPAHDAQQVCPLHRGLLDGNVVMRTKTQT
jgi:hypothetical protein